MRAVLTKSTSDMIKSKIKSGNLSELVFDVYITPREFADIIEKYNEEEFELTIE